MTKADREHEKIFEEIKELRKKLDFIEDNRLLHMERKLSKINGIVTVYIPVIGFLATLVGVFIGKMF